MKKLIPIFSFFIIIVLFQKFINFNEKKNLSLNNVKKCHELDYKNHKLNRAENFSEIEMDLVIENERKWKKIILNSHISDAEDKSFTYKAKYTDATIRVKNKYGFDCTLKAKIKPHGDLLDHYRDYGTGYDPIYVLPSLKVKLLEGNIFGIVEFRLLIPKTRNNGNEIFATTLFQKLKLYAPRTTYSTIIYNKKKYRFLFQEKLNKEFLEKNSLQEGVFFAGDERFSFKYEGIKTNQYGKSSPEKEIGISKFRVTESKFLKKNKIFIKPTIEAVQALNVSSHFYSSGLKQSELIDYFTTQKKKKYEKFFLNLPEFDALMYSIGAEHGLSRDDRRFYHDILNNNFIPIYYDGAVRIFLLDDFNGPNKYSDIETKLNKGIKFINSAKIGSLSVVNKIDNIDINNLQKTMIKRGLNVTILDLKLVIKLIKKNLIILSGLNNDQIVEVSNSNQHSLKNKEAIKKDIKASYIFTTNDGFKKCDLLLNNCLNIELTPNELRKALKQDLKDKNGNDFIFLGGFDEFQETQIENKDEVTLNSNNLFTFQDINFKVFGNVEVNIDKINRIIKFSKKNSESRVLFFNSLLNNWSLEFTDLTKKNKDIIPRDTNGLSGCLNIYDSKIENLKVFIKEANCEDAINLVRTKGSIIDLKINNTLFDGLDADFSSLIIKNVQISNSGNDCMDFSYGNYFLKNIDLLKCQDKAISVGEGSNLEIKKFTITKSNIGIASKDSAHVNSINGNIIDVDNCLSLYKKKQEFNGGLLEYKNLSCQNYNSFAFVDNYSKLIEIN